ncbi:MAG: acyl-CoA dehydrogenase [Paracoccaceae bacterium]|nr:acyl-CoA dehydrogenase [Paracoccaceae bacterium]
MPYTSPVTDYQFIFDNLVGFDRLAQTETFADATSDVRDAILAEAGKLADTVMAPLNRSGDLTPSVLENGVVRTSPGFVEGYQKIAEGGWVGMCAKPENGGMGLPQALGAAVADMMSGACLALQLCPLLSQGQIEALEHHGSDDLKTLYLPKLTSGEWTGTMNLTEPQAGSDVGALKSKAVDNGDGTYAISGQKIYITWGDHDAAENICHLVLARLPEGGDGTKGISLFLVPKFIPDEAGKPGVANSLKVVSLEHKMGIHGSPTAVMQYDGATGWLVGQGQGGMKAMFTMMNNARLGVAAQGVGMAEAAFQHALAFSQDRKQGRTPVEGKGAIFDHADVRRMLMTMRADTFAARAICASNAVAIDMARATDSADWQTRAALLTPISKAFCTDIANEVASDGLQVFGGMGFIEETGAAQYARDARILPIYEGTNGIQAMDLVARKMADGGDGANALLDEIVAGTKAAQDRHADMAKAVYSAAETLREAVDYLTGQGDLNARFAVAVPFLRAFARVLGGHFHLQAALSEKSAGPRTALAQFYINRMLPEHQGLCDMLRQGTDGLYALSAEEMLA